MESDENVSFFFHRSQINFRYGKRSFFIIYLLFYYFICTWRNVVIANYYYMFLSRFTFVCDTFRTFIYYHINKKKCNVFIKIVSPISQFILTFPSLDQFVRPHTFVFFSFIFFLSHKRDVWNKQKNRPPPQTQRTIVSIIKNFPQFQKLHIYNNDGFSKKKNAYSVKSQTR